VYPASRLPAHDFRRPAAARILASVAAMVLLFAGLEIFSVLRPAAPYFERGGVVLPSCGLSMGGGKEPPGSPPIPERDICHEVVPDSRLPLRIGIGAGAMAVVVALMAEATNISRRRAEPA
jgi:hypothetical protein